VVIAVRWDSLVLGGCWAIDLKGRDEPAIFVMPYGRAESTPVEHARQRAEEIAQFLARHLRATEGR
jgi:hypothetical protein